MTKNRKKQNKTNAALKYSGMVSQMLALILVAVFLGKKIDNYFENEQAYGVILLLFTFMGAYFYKLVKDLSSDKEKNG